MLLFNKNTRGRIRTDTGRILSPLSLPLDYTGGWEQIDLNYRPPRYQHVALPLSYAPEVGYVGFEPTTNRLKAEYSTAELITQTLSVGLEPTTL